MLFLPLIALCGCSGEEDAISGGAQQPGEALQISVSAGDFSVAGAPDTRATDNGAVTTFENGDRVGVIILDANNSILANNIPYKYNGSQWTFDNNNGEGKSQCYYDYKAKTYIVYYPYSASANGVTSESDLKKMFVPKENQQSEDDYRSSDLLVWISTSSVPLKTLNAALTHAYASVSLSPEVKYTLDDGNKTVLSCVSSRVSDVCVTVGNGVSFPFQAEDGSFRCILPAGTSGSVRWFYTFDGKRYGSSHELGSGATANTRYAQETIVDNGLYNLNMAQPGDFYCKNASGKGYLVPGEISSLSDGQKNACLGIVYWVGDIKGDNYGLLNEKFPDSMHGLVVSLWDMPAPDNPNSVSMTWTYGGYEYVNAWLDGATWSDGNTRPNNFSSIQVTDKMQGYANTIALEEYNKHVEKSSGDGYGLESNKRVKPVKGLAAFGKAHPAPLNSSGWYWSSVCELKYVCWGQGNGGGTSGRDHLNTNISKVGGTLFGYGYWPSTENSSYSHAWYVNFYDGDVYGYNSKSTYYRVRPLLAF